MCSGSTLRLGLLGSFGFCVFLVALDLLILDSKSATILDGISSKMSFVGFALSIGF